jgi:hypothetical protein
MPISGRQSWFYHLAIKLRRGSGFNRSNSTPEISEGRFRLRPPRQPRTAIAASDAMKRTTIVISKKVNVPRVNTFKAAAIATYDREPNIEVTKKIENVSVAVSVEDQLRDRVSGS